MGQKQLNPPAKSKEILVVVVVLFAFYHIGFRVACMDASNETYFKLQELDIKLKLDMKLKGSLNIESFKKNIRKKRPNVTLKQQQ